MKTPHFYIGGRRGFEPRTPGVKPVVFPDAPMNGTVRTAQKSGTIKLAPNEMLPLPVSRDSKPSFQGLKPPRRLTTELSNAFASPAEPLINPLAVKEATLKILCFIGAMSIKIGNSQ